MKTLLPDSWTGERIICISKQDPAEEARVEVNIVGYARLRFKGGYLMDLTDRSDVQPIKGRRLIFN